MQIPSLYKEVSLSSKDILQKKKGRTGKYFDSASVHSNIGI
jgi:hypothetical protein